MTLGALSLLLVPYFKEIKLLMAFFSVTFSLRMPSVSYNWPL